MESAPAATTGGYPDRVKKAEKRIDNDPWDVEAWQIIFKDAQSRRIEQARDTYERLVRQFPTSVVFWKTYIQHEMRGGPKCANQVERLFQRCLLKVLHIDLWKLYLAYVKDPKRYTQSQQNAGNAQQSNNPAANKDRLIQAYEFALEKMSSDWNAYSLWNDYITFLRNVETQSQYADQQKILAIRKMYQHACATPMVAIESLWKDYSAFENETNVVIAKKLLDDKARDYLNARRVTREYETITRGLNRAHLSLPPPRSAADSFLFDAAAVSNQPNAVRIESEKQLALWRRYITWEKENPLRTDDYLTVVKRVMFAYEQCLLSFHLFPEVWLDAAFFLQQAARTVQQQRSGDTQAQATYTHLLNEVEKFFERAYLHGPLRTAALLYLAHADFEEQRANFDKVHAIYERYFYITSTAASKSAAGPLKKKEKEDPGDQETSLVAGAGAGAATNGETVIAEREKEKESEQSEAVTNVWCAYIRFCRRIDGIVGARNAFRRARTDLRCTSSLFLCAAELEYRVAKQPEVARRVFELGMRRFANDVPFVLAYLQLLIQLNRENDTRVLFERVLGSTDIPPQSLAPVWDRYLEFEQTVGDHETVRKVRERRLAALHSIAVQRAVALVSGSSNVNASDAQGATDKRKQAEREVQFAALNVNDTPFWLMHFRATVSRPRFDDAGDELVDDTDRRDPGRLSKLAVGWLNQGTSAMSGRSGLAGNVGAGINIGAEWSTSAFARPNVAQMLPFKPRVDPAPLLRVVEGGEFQAPPAIELLLSRLPPAHDFRGPFVILDAFVQHVLSLKLPDLDETYTAMSSIDEDAGTSHSVAVAGAGKSASRRPKTTGEDLKVVASKRSRWDDDDPNEEGNSGQAMSNSASANFAVDQTGAMGKAPLDLFRVRQLKRKK